MARGDYKIQACDAPLFDQAGAAQHSQSPNWKLQSPSTVVSAQSVQGFNGPGTVFRLAGPGLCRSAPARKLNRASTRPRVGALLLPVPGEIDALATLHCQSGCAFLSLLVRMHPDVRRNDRPAESHHRGDGLSEKNPSVSYPVIATSETITRSELGCCSGQKFPVRALFLPVHQDVEIGGTFLAIGDGLTFAHPVETHDRCRADDTNIGVFVL